MKNRYLFVILISLFSLAYYLEEYRPKQLEKLSQNNDSFVIIAKNITEINLPHNKLKKINLTWQHQTLNEKIDFRKIQKFIDIISTLKVVDKVSYKEEYFSKTNLEFSLVNMSQLQKFKFGNVSMISGKFYLQDLAKPNFVYICQSEAVLNDIFKNELELNLKKYIRLRKFIESDKFFFLDKKLFKDISLKEISKVRVDNKRNRFFDIDLIRGETNPSKFYGLKYKNISKELLVRLDQSQFSHFIDQDNIILSDLISELTINYQPQNKKGPTVVRLYATLNGKFGRYVKFKDNKKIYVLKSLNNSIFVSNMQDFWLKKHNLGTDISGLKNFSFSLSFDDKKFFNFRVKNTENFKVSSESKQIDNLKQFKFNFLFNLILNLTEFKEASYITELNSKEDIVDKEIIINIFDKKYMITIGTSMIEVVDLSLKLKYYYAYDNSIISKNFFADIFRIKTK